MPPCCQSNFFGCLWGGIASPNMHLVFLLCLIFRSLPVFLELCSILLLLRVVFVVSVYFLIFVLVVCSSLLLLSGRTTGYFAGQSTAVVEILQSSAPGLVMVMMMVGNAAAVGAGDGRCCYCLLYTSPSPRD